MVAKIIPTNAAFSVCKTNRWGTYDFLPTFHVRSQEKPLYLWPSNEPCMDLLWG